MCGRYSLTTPVEALGRLFRFSNRPNVQARYNIAPTQEAPVIYRQPDEAEGEPVLAMMRWGLIPHWAKDATMAARMINARAETVAEKPSFRDAYRARRCLVPADGYFEWRKEGAQKQPYYFTRADGHPMALAGLWARWTPKEPQPQAGLNAGESLDTFTLITVAANAAVSEVHHRMPLALDEKTFDLWLSGKQAERAALDALLVPADIPLAITAVSTRVNSPRNDDPECLQPVEQNAAEQSPLKESDSFPQKLL